VYNQPLLPETHPESESEREVLETTESVCQALVAAGFRVSRLPVGRDPAILAEGVRRHAPDVVFNLFEGLGDDSATEATVAGLLEWLGVPFTGSTGQTIGLSRSKPLAKHVLHAAGLPTPDFFVVDAATDSRLQRGVSSLKSAVRPGNLSWPVIVKAANQDASVGIDQGSVVTGVGQLRKRVGLLLERYGPPVLVEQYIAGRELTVGVVEVPELRALPPSEFVFKPRDDATWQIVTYDAKWRVASVDFQHTPFCKQASVAPDLFERLHHLALRAYRVLGVRDYGRVDFRIASSGEAFILEGNPNPDLSPEAALADGLEAAGTSHAEFVVQLARRALARQGRGLRSGQESDRRSPVWTPPTTSVTRPVDTGRN
jgi:D-alanine-D-alanine ligase